MSRNNRLLFGFGNNDFEDLILQSSLTFDLLDSINDYDFYTLNNDLKLKKGDSNIITFDSTSDITIHNNLSVTGDTFIEGKVGIGTLSPNYKLDISGDINVTGDLLINGIIQTFGKWNYNLNKIYYNTGNVGIGTNSPDDLLHIEGSSPILKISNTEETWSGIRFCDSGAPTTQNFDILYSSSNQDLKIRSDNLDNIMYFEYNTGHIGIGLDNPTSPLHIVATTSKIGNFVNNNGVGTGTFIEINNDFGTRCLIGCNGSGFSGTDTSTVSMGNWSNGDLELRAGGNIKMTLKSGGDVGIGTTSPDEKLEVNGNIKCDKVIPSTAGQLLNSVFINNQTIINAVINTTSYEDVILYTYTPKSSNSKILITFDTDYNIDGNNSDSFVAYMEVSWLSLDILIIDIIQQKRQYFNNANGGGTRSSTLFPISGVYDNTNTEDKYIKIRCKRISSDDDLNIVTTDNTFTIQEIAD